MTAEKKPLDVVAARLVAIFRAVEERLANEAADHDQEEAA